METINHPDSNNSENKFRNNRNPAGRVLGGLFIISLGCLYLAKQMGIFFPDWVFTWQMFLIGLGVYIGLRSMFQNAAWFILILIGGVMMIDEFYPGVEFKQYLWPIVLISVGLFMVFRPRGRGRKDCKKWNKFESYNNDNTSKDDVLDVTTVFGGVKKNVMTKDFKGGEVNCFFGGTEINLMNADLTSPVKLEINQVFGGTKLIIPSHWILKSEIVAILGGVDDKRAVSSNSVSDQNKILILEGNCVFGGIEIRSY